MHGPTVMIDRASYIAVTTIPTMVFAIVWFSLWAFINLVPFNTWLTGRVVLERPGHGVAFDWGRWSGCGGDDALGLLNPIRTGSVSYESVWAFPRTPLTVL